MHYQRMQTTGTTDKVIKLCSLDDCDKRLFKDGFCRTHWARWDQFGDPRVIRECSIEGCSRPAASTTRNWCLMHYTRWAKHGDVGEVEPRIWQPPRESAEGCRWCTTCHAELPLKEFHREKASPSGWANVCRDCRRDIHTAQLYGITAAAYRRLLEQQGGVCRICRKPETATHQAGTLRRLSVDHDHRCCPGKKSCGKCVRGLLCARCNSAIGLFDEDPAILHAAVEYLVHATPAKKTRKASRGPLEDQGTLWGDETTAA